MIIDITQEAARENAERAQRTAMRYVGKTYPHFQGALEELKSHLVSKGCRLEEYITPVRKMLAVDVYFNEVYSGGITNLENGPVWTLVVTNDDLIVL